MEAAEYGVPKKKSSLRANDICGYRSASPLKTDILTYRARIGVGIGCQSI
jgi:hypothetical protein